MTATADREGMDLQQLVLRSESVVDDVLRQQLKEVQRQQDKVFHELLSVQRLLDYLPLLEHQQKEQLSALRRHRKALRELRLLTGPRQASSDSEDEGGGEGSDAKGDGKQGKTAERSAKSKKKADQPPVPVDALVNIGCNTYLKARGDDVGKLLVKVGFQFYLEMTLEEAADFLTKKEAILLKKYDHWSAKCADIKAQIQVFLQAIAAVVEEPALREFPYA
ncbi:prefoldin subunit [Toxoplasma gondii TgCatPRC2]|uniref:Prefoldin subunit n=1 Tax=Toxoplasma gondii TgCatPRC2 TaxID=1130821 RepID=A0A151HAV7_TOXGO|nr:prefoldin subunit [Toxoplasma gondii TgCatPRC2]